MIFPSASASVSVGVGVMPTASPSLGAFTGGSGLLTLGWVRGFGGVEGLVGFGVMVGLAVCVIL